MKFKKSETKRIVTFAITIASLLIGMPFIMNNAAFAGDEMIVEDKVGVRDRPFNPFLANNEDLDKFFFERDVLGIIEGEFEDNPLFQQGNRNAFERDANFRADD